MLTNRTLYFKLDGGEFILNFIKSIIIVFSFTFIIYGQNQLDSDLFFIVDSIKISGNKTTEDFVILNELTFKIGDKISEVILLFNRERIYSLGLFNQVTVEKLFEGGKNIILIEVEESWYIFPVPFVDIKERDYKKLSYGIYLVYRNFRGRNETIFGAASFGYNPSYGINYINPNLTSDGKYFLRFSSYYSKKLNRSIIAESEVGQRFNFTQISTLLLLGKRFDAFNKLFGNISFNYLEVDDSKLNYTISSERIDKYPQIGIGYEYDKRDLIQFPRQGSYFFLSLNQNGIGFNSINYQLFKIDFRKYLDVFDNLFLKFRTSSRMTIGEKVPIYDYSLIGTDEKIRGNFFKRIEDRNYLTLSSEIYYPILSETHLNLSFIPIIPDELLSYRIAIYIQSFADYGSVFKDFYKTSNSLSGYGIGLSLLVLPYNVIRFELGFNEKSQPEFIVDLGKSF